MVWLSYLQNELIASHGNISFHILVVILGVVQWIRLLVCLFFGTTQGGCHPHWSQC
jgi:hypothetical protein